MTKQSLFDRFVEVFVVNQAEQSVVAQEPHPDGYKPGPMCMYRAPNKAGCAIGCQHEFQAIYQPEMEKRNIGHLIHNNDQVRELFRGIGIDYLQALQDLHDFDHNWGRKGVILALPVVKFAKQWGLTMLISNAPGSCNQPMPPVG